MTGRLLIFGASGFTGRLLAQRARTSCADTILAGRNRERLERVARECGLPCRVLALEDRRGLDAGLRDIAVVINAAGPFVSTARPMLEACLRAGTHYLDVSGELPVFQQAHGYDEAARAAGVMVMPGVGIVVVATDCLAAHVAAHMPDACRLRLAMSHTDLVSRGTYTSMIGLVREGVTVRRDGRLCAVPAGQLERGFDFGEGERLSTAFSWPDVFTAYCTTGIPNIEVYVEAGAWARSFYQLASYFAELLRLAPARKLLELQARFLPEGPSEEQRAAAPRVLVAEAEDRYRRCVEARLHTPNGYSFTALSALAIAERAIIGDVRTGFQTPAGVYGADFVLSLEGVRRDDATRTYPSCDRTYPHAGLEQRSL
jgi:short subunit dehydrogenase-like uncharacterized protein